MQSDPPLFAPPLFGTTLRDYLSGTWNVQRQIDDRRGNGKARFDGSGVFTLARGALDYAETGRLTVGERGHDAAQANRWIITADDAADVLFADGRFFHHVALAGYAAHATHHCAPDDYAATYLFEGRSRWHLTWNVTGPRKDYTSHSVFTRLHRPAQPLMSGTQRYFEGNQCPQQRFPRPIGPNQTVRAVRSCATSC